MTKTDRTLIEHTINDLRVALRQLHHQKKTIDSEIESLTTRIDEWQTYLGQNGNSKSPRRRRKKGEALRLILAHFRNPPPNKELSITEIAKATGVSWSSARYALQKNTDAFSENDENGLWSHRETTA